MLYITNFKILFKLQKAGFHDIIFIKKEHAQLQNLDFDFQIRINQTKMSVKKAIGAGLLVALVGCEQIQATAFGLAQLPVAAGSQIYLVNDFQKPQTFAPSTSGPGCNNPQHRGSSNQNPASIPTSQSVPPVKIPSSNPSNGPQPQWRQRDDDKNDQNQQIVHNHPGGQPYGQTLDKDNRGKSDEVKQNQPIKSESGHFHTPDNKAGGNPDDEGSKHSWKDKQGNPHETVQAKDNEGKYHQIHRWQDNRGRSHETENWTDSKNSVHQCHRWQDDKGETHEAVHVTKSDGTVVSQHFAKDKEGKIRKIEKKEADSDKKDEKESDSGKKGHLKSERDQDSSSSKNGHKDRHEKASGKKEHLKQERDQDSSSSKNSRNEKDSSKNNGHHAGFGGVSSGNTGSHDHSTGSVGVGATVGTAGSILHTANCVVSNNNIRTHS